MKRFWKISFLIIGIVTGIGCLLLLAGAAFGGVGEAWDMAQKGELPFVNVSDSHGIKELREEIQREIAEHKEYTEWDDQRFVEVPERNHYTNDEVASAGEIEALSLDIAGCSLTVMKTEGDAYRLEATNSDGFYYGVEDGVLVLSSRVDSDWMEDTEKWDKGRGELEDVLQEVRSHAWNGQIILYVPEDAVLTTADVEVSAGRVTFTDIDMTDMSLEVNAGEFICQGGVTGEVDIECRMGSVALSLSGSMEDYNYDLETQMGEIQITQGSRAYGCTGLNQDKWVDNGREESVQIECQMGAVNVSFVE